MTTPTDIVTARDSLEWYDQKQVAVARGDAVAVRNGRTIKGDVLTAYMVKTATSAGESRRAGRRAGAGAGEIAGHAGCVPGRGQPARPKRRTRRSAGSMRKAMWSSATGSILAAAITASTMPTPGSHADRQRRHRARQGCDQRAARGHGSEDQRQPGDARERAERPHQRVQGLFVRQEPACSRGIRVGAEPPAARGDGRQEAVMRSAGGQTPSSYPGPDWLDQRAAPRRRQSRPRRSRSRQELQAPPGAARRQRVGAARRGGRPARPQRRRQDHLLLHHHRADRRRYRHGRARRPGHHRYCRCIAAPGWASAICRRKPRSSAA